MVARYDQKQYRQNAACSPSLLFLCFFPQLDQAFPPFSFGKWQQETRSHESLYNAPEPSMAVLMKTSPGTASSKDQEQQHCNAFHSRE
ncbi:hypothetical protein E2P81_ATG10843 [Venturia nashicola]|nr:hypothetical protein E2P81_ATG10843 [Venturia nashicola]